MFLNRDIYYSPWSVLDLCGKTETATFLSSSHFLIENTCVSSFHGISADQDFPASYEQLNGISVKTWKAVKETELILFNYGFI